VRPINSYDIFLRARGSITANGANILHYGKLTDGQAIVAGTFIAFKDQDFVCN